jgi:hypothetical protein
LKLSIPSQSSRNLPRFLRLLYCRRPTVSVPSASHWAYSGFAVETHDSGEYRCVRQTATKSRAHHRAWSNDNPNKDLKNLFKSAAISASTRPGPLQDFYVALLAKGIRPTMARLTLARKMAAVSLTIWKKGVNFDPKQLHRQAA